MAFSEIEVKKIDKFVGGLCRKKTPEKHKNASIGHYNAQHPRGKKYSINELKVRRDDAYEQHTRHLLSPVNYILTQDNYQLPHVGYFGGEK